MAKKGYKPEDNKTKKVNKKKGTERGAAQQSWAVRGGRAGGVGVKGHTQLVVDTQG